MNYIYKMVINNINKMLIPCGNIHHHDIVLEYALILRYFFII